MVPFYSPQTHPPIRISPELFVHGWAGLCKQFKWVSLHSTAFQLAWPGGKMFYGAYQPNPPEMSHDARQSNPEKLMYVMTSALLRLCCPAVSFFTLYWRKGQVEINKKNTEIQWMNELKYKDSQWKTIGMWNILSNFFSIISASHTSNSTRAEQGKEGKEEIKSDILVFFLSSRLQQLAPKVSVSSFFFSVMVTLTWQRPAGISWHSG